MDITVMIWPQVDRAAIAHVLEGVGSDVRLNTVMELGKRELSELFEATSDNPVTLDDLVPADVPPMTEVIHEGKNSLAMFRRFQKRFCRPRAEIAQDELWG